MPKNIYGGGSRTNENGLRFEQETKLLEVLNNTDGYTVEDKVVFYEKEEVAKLIGKHSMYNDFLIPNGINYEDYISYQLLPDEALFVYNYKTVYIIEKKFQNGPGSVDEKLQTCDFKKKQYTKLFQHLDIAVEYIYLLNDFFKNEKYKDVLEYVIDSKCHYFFNEIPLSFLNLPN